LKDLQKILLDIKSFLDIHLFDVGTTSITLWSFIYFLFLAWLLFFFTNKLKNWIVYRVLSNSKIELGVRLAVGTIIRYFILVLGLIIVMQTVGINLSTLTILAGALGVGIGFGLQNVTIQVGDVYGDVVSISMRSTTVVTNDNISVIVPNSEFISSTVINWSHTDRNVRFNIPVGVAYKEDPEKVREILIEIAAKEEGVLKKPVPDVLFDEFGDSSLNFNLRVWTDTYTTRPGILKSRLYFEIFKKFKEQHIEIPFPQRDLHVKKDESESKSADN